MTVGQIGTCACIFTTVINIAVWQAIVFVSDMHFRLSPLFVSKALESNTLAT